MSYFIAIGALVGVSMMILDPSGIQFGMDTLMQMLQEAFPFAYCLFFNLYASALALLSFIGIPNIAVIVLIHRNNKFAPLCTFLCGVILSLWISVELYAWGPTVLSLLFGVLALLQISIALAWKNKKD